tara:strand:- start:64 stop:738 length:675 start_codon:yes stop_codon:yes gene_type:complete
MLETKEKQYQDCINLRNSIGLTNLGYSTAISYNDDPKRLTFTFSRYKFVAKMFSGYSNVLEIGCGDGFASRIVLQEVDNLTAVDFDPVFVDDVNQNMQNNWYFDCFVHNILESSVKSKYFDGIFSLDVLEHIEPKDENTFMKNLTNSLKSNGSAIIGMPSINSQVYASPRSKEGHVNCKSENELKSLMEKYFNNVFIFSMNDEVVHTGFHPMSQYFLALCCYPK